MEFNGGKGALIALTAIGLTIFIVIKLFSNVDMSASTQATVKNDDDYYLTGKYGTINQCLKNAKQHLKKHHLKYKLTGDKPTSVSATIYHPDDSEVTGMNNSFSCTQKETGTEGVYYELFMFVPPEYRNQ